MEFPLVEELGEKHNSQDLSKIEIDSSN